jgi:hypothetical protein
MNNAVFDEYNDKNNSNFVEFVNQHCENCKKRAATGSLKRGWRRKGKTFEVFEPHCYKLCRCATHCNNMTWGTHNCIID